MRPAGALLLVHSAPFDFLGFGMFPSLIHVEVYVSPDERQAVVCLIDSDANPGTSAVNAAGQLVRDISARLLTVLAPDAHVRWADVHTGEGETRYAWLHFGDPFLLTGAGWGPIYAQEAETLIGTSPARPPHTGDHP